MPQLSPAGNKFIEDLAQRHGVSTDAATHMLIAVSNGNGTMAQFCHSEFGGSGQWMQGGMTMVSDLFNNHLKNRVNNICGEIANALANHQLTPFAGSFQSQSQQGNHSQIQSAGIMGGQNSLFAPDPEAHWWPADLGTPNATGAQNNLRYAYFGSSRRLAVKTGSDIWVYDTLDHAIGGFSQQQSGGSTISFSSQLGTVDVSTLPVVSRNGVPQSPQPNPPAFRTESSGDELSRDQGTSQASNASVNAPSSQNSVAPSTAQFSASEGILDTIERLGVLREKGLVTDDEFAHKKAELLSRL